MTPEKLRRVVTAAVGAGTILLVTLLAYLIYQFVAIGVLNKRLDEVTKDITELQTQNSELQELESYYGSDIGKLWLAMEKGFILKQGD